MFICSVKASSVKFFGILGLATVLLVALIFTLPESGNLSASTLSDNDISFNKIKTNEDRIDFLKQFGWEVESDPIEEQEIKISSDFDKVMSSYNDIQNTMGLDLTKYQGKKVNRYTYRISNYPNYEGTVYANVIVFKNKVIGGDICSADIKGFIHNFEKPE